MKHIHDTKHSALKPLKIAGMAIGGVALAVLFAFLFGLLVQYLWNWLMPGLFGLGTITYWQAVAMVILAKLLFGSLGGHRHHDRPRGMSDRRIRVPSEIRKNGRSFSDFWEEEGREAFEKFMDRVNGKEGGSNQ
ncbi:MAG: hypothetical protein JW838_06600 [Spirochaetes bacterium]|nr:hypothetical protein [Spirochaetota bacterium]